MEKQFFSNKLGFLNFLLRKYNIPNLFETEFFIHRDNT